MNEKKIVKPSRLVVFVSGFDPRSGRYYHRLCSQQAKLQAKVDQISYVVGERREIDSSVVAGNHCVWGMGRQSENECEYVFFNWTEEIKSHWPKSLIAVFGSGFQTYWEALQSWRGLLALKKVLPYTLLAFAYPMIFMLAMGIVFGVGSLGIYEVIDNEYYRVSVLFLFLFSFLFLGKKLDRIFYFSWLLRIFNFARRSAHNLDDVSENDNKINEMSRWLAGRVKENPELELVIMGFSVGSVNALKITQATLKCLKENKSSTREDGVTLITLGNCIPLFSLFPAANNIRSRLIDAAENPDIFWIDISSPSDSVSFAMCDLMGLAFPEKTNEEKKYINPRHMCTPRFHKLFTPEKYNLIRRNKMHMHFQYLMASEKKGAYNFFAMMTSPISVRKFVEKFLVR